MNDQKLATFLAVLAALFYACMSIMAKYATASQSNFTITLFRFLVSLILLLPAMRKEDFKQLKTNRYLCHLIRGLTGVGALFCLFYALKYIPVVNALLLNATFPIFTALIYKFYKKVKTSKAYWFFIGLSFFGVILALHPKIDHLFNHVSIIALSAGLLTAWSLVAQKELTRTESSKTITFYFFFISILCALPLTLLTWQNLSSITLLTLIAVGIFGALYQMTAIIAYKKASARYIAGLMYLNILFGGLLDWVLFGQAPSALTMVGLILVVFASIMLSRCSSTPPTQNISGTKVIA